MVKLGRIRIGMIFQGKHDKSLERGILSSDVKARVIKLATSVNTFCVREITLRRKMMNFFVFISTFVLIYILVNQEIII